MSEITKICPICDKEFTILPGYTAKRRFCYDDHHVTCCVCGKDFVASNKIALYVKNGGETTCSKQCKYKLDFEINGVYKKCIACGKEFRLSAPSTKICNDDHYKTCVMCGKEFVCNNLRVWEGNKPAICKECYHDYVKKRRHDGGVRGTDKRRKTCLEKYGVDNYAKTDEFKEKYEDTCMEHYGVPYYLISEDCQSKQLRKVSNVNKRFAEFLRSNNIEVDMEFYISHRSYDMLITGTNILIEIDPTISHNTVDSYLYRLGKSENNYPKSYDYHLFKTLLAEENGYRCIHLFDWDWNNDKSLDLIRQDKTKIYARNCRIREVDKSDTDEFLDLYHLQNTCRYQNIRLGLYYKGMLVQIMTFGKPRYNSKYEYELIRLCTKSGYSIVGGSERLFKYFIKNYSPESIISYCDKAKFTGDVYHRLGMKYLYTTEPRCHWSKDSRQITDNLLKQYGYDSLFKTNHGKGTDNKKLMIEDGWRPVYDCGQMVFEWNRE